VIGRLKRDRGYCAAGSVSSWNQRREMAAAQRPARLQERREPTRQASAQASRREMSSSRSTVGQHKVRRAQPTGSERSGPLSLRGSSTRPRHSSCKGDVSGSFGVCSRPARCGSLRGGPDLMWPRRMKTSPIRSSLAGTCAMTRAADRQRKHLNFTVPTIEKLKANTHKASSRLAGRLMAVKRPP
jgi:hypothetical protein